MPVVQCHKMLLFTSMMAKFQLATKFSANDNPSGSSFDSAAPILLVYLLPPRTQSVDLAAVGEEIVAGHGADDATLEYAKKGLG